MSHGKDGENVERGTHRINPCALCSTHNDKSELEVHEVKPVWPIW